MGAWVLINARWYYLLFDEVSDGWTWLGAGIIFTASYHIMRGAGKH